MPSSNYPGQANLADPASHVSITQFIIRQMLGRVWTATLVQVQSCTNSGADSPVGTVSVQPLVAMVDAAGTTQAHGTIYNLPYFRLQGGSNAVIIDPAVGDIGVCVFASRDISAAKTNKAPSAPGSFRRFDPADGLYLGGFLGAAPTQYLQFIGQVLNAVAASQINLNAPVVTTSAVLRAGNGASGTCQSADGKTLTFAHGILTSIV